MRNDVVLHTVMHSLGKVACELPDAGLGVSLLLLQHLSPYYKYYLEICVVYCLVNFRLKSTGGLQFVGEQSYG